MDGSDDGRSTGSGVPPTPRDPDLVFVPGDRCGQDYVIQGLVARGGMAQIFHARHEIMRRDVAIKVLAPRYVGRADVRGRMEAEARALAEIDHPNIVKIFHAGRDSRVELYIVMELLDGKDLRTIMDWAGALPIADAIAYAIEIADATAALHELGIFHRDIKPENVFVVRGRAGAGRVLKLLDLGAAKIPKYGHRTTGSFNTIGTGAYMSPEHVRGQPITAASDVYSLGLMLYEMIAGRHAFGFDHPTTPTHADFCRWQLLAKPEALRSLVPAVSPSLEALLAHALEKDPTRRLGSMASFATSLRACLREALATAEQAQSTGAAGDGALSARRQVDTLDGPASDPDTGSRAKTTRPDRAPLIPREGEPAPDAAANDVERDTPASTDDDHEAVEAPAPSRTRLWTAPLVGLAAAVVLVAAVLAVRGLHRPAVEPSEPSSVQPVPSVEPAATAPEPAAVPATPEKPDTSASSADPMPPPPVTTAKASATPVGSARPVAPVASSALPQPATAGTSPPAPSVGTGPAPFKEIF